MPLSFDSIKTQYFHHGRFPVKGGVLPDAVTAYRCYGDPKNPCIVFPTCYGAKLDSQSYLVGEDKVLDPTKYFIVTFALFSNGESSSPSNTAVPYNGPYFPAISHQDNIRAQHAVLLHLAVKRVFLVIGFSMGGQQAYHWAVIHPEFVDRYVSICGSARTSIHNQCFLEGPKAALVASKDFKDGHYKATPEFGLRAFGRVYSAWAYGQTWFRNKQYLHDGTYPTLEAFLKEQWEETFVSHWDANDLLCLMGTWQSGDVSLVRDAGDLERCLQGVARGIDGGGDKPEDSFIEGGYLGNSARVVVIESDWGHVAGGGSNPADTAFIEQEVRKFMEEA